MKAIAIDSSTAKLIVAAKNDDKTVNVVIDIGMRQSELLLPAIDYVLKKTDVHFNDLDYTVLCKGPGSFTGLRLSYAVLKAVNMAFDVPIFGVSKLYATAFPFMPLQCLIIPVLEAKKGRFFAALYNGAEKILDDGEYEADDVLMYCHEKALVCGHDIQTFIDNVKEDKQKLLRPMLLQPDATYAMFEIAETMIKNKEAPLKDFDGPSYIRASEAEAVLAIKQHGQL